MMIRGEKGGERGEQLDDDGVRKFLCVLVIAPTDHYYQSLHWQ